MRKTAHSLSFSVHVEHSCQRATLHTRDCPEFLTRDPDDPAVSFWSAPIRSESDAVAAVLRYLRDPDGARYAFERHCCVARTI